MTKTLRFSLTVLALAVVAAAGFVAGRLVPGSEPAASTRRVAYWRAPMDPTEIYDAPGKSRMGMDLIPVYEDEVTDSGKADEGAHREIAYWRAPMDPTEIYDAPGKSRMGMDLIPVYTDELGGDSGGIVRIDPATVQSMGVLTQPVERKAFSRTIRTVGDVAYDEERLFTVNSKVSGWIERLYVTYVGQEVRAGDPLMELYSPDLVSTQEEYLLAVRSYRALGPNAPDDIRADAMRLVSAARTRLEYWDISAEEIQRLETTGEPRKTLLVSAPATGMVLERNVLDGAFVQAGKDLFRIADLSQVWVHASLYDYEAPWVTAGQPVDMELSYLPGKTYHGTVSYIYPYLREKARDIHIRLIFRNTADIDLKPGMYANIRLEGRPIPDALVIPSAAVIRSGERTLVFVARGDGRFEPREIRIGELGGKGNAEIRVLDGLLAGEEIVTSAQFLMDSESRLQEAVQKMMADRAGTAGRAEGSANGQIPESSTETEQPAAGAVDHGSMPGMTHEAAGDTSMKGMDHRSMQRMDHGAIPDSSMRGMDHGSMQGTDHGTNPDTSMKAMDHGAMPEMDHGAKADSSGHKHGTGSSAINR